jgi:hypothetical protein
MESNPEVQAFVAELILTATPSDYKQCSTNGIAASSFKDPWESGPDSEKKKLHLIDFETRQYIGDADYVGPAGKEFVITWVKPTNGIYGQRLEPRFANTYFVPAVPGTNWFMWSGGEKWWIKDN